MKYRKAPRKSAKGKSLLLTFLLLLSVPVFVYGVMQNSSFDTRDKAFDDVEVSADTPCVITFPNVNPYSLEVGKTVRVQVDAMSTTLGIKTITVKDGSQNTLYQQTYSSPPQNLSETFPFTPQTTGEYDLTGLMIDLNGKTYSCVISSTYDVKGVRAITSNGKPEFTTTPKQSTPSQAIKTDQTYEYTLEATDPDGDTINYSYSFTPGSNWLKPTVIEDGSDGRLTIKFKGTPTEAASYLANIFIHDGYNSHLASQSWVISVSPENNDNPVVKIVDPVEALNVTDSSPIKITWEASDENHIVKYQLYLSSNPANEDTWIKIDDNIPYNQTSYSIKTDNIKNGTYRAIVKAVDNQTPAAEGIDISQEILIAKGDTQQDEGNSDQVVLPEPQIINVSPTSTDEIKNSRPTIKASLVATEGKTIDENTINVKLDDKDITNTVNFNKISSGEYTVIYLPDQDLTGGLHKVEITFKDSSNTQAEKSWTFTIQSTDTENSDSINILGYSIPKRTALIVAGGVGLVILAIVIPIIIFAVWKDQSNETTVVNPTLPPTVPTEDSIPLDNSQKNDLQTLTQDETFQAPEPQEEIPQPPVEPSTVQDVPEPTNDDFSQIYSQIKEAEQGDDTTPQQPPSPPEPVL